jgi:xanthine dehydrogenase accessory factor
VSDLEDARQRLREGEIPVLVDPDCEILSRLVDQGKNTARQDRLDPVVLVDGRMTKDPGTTDLNKAALVIGLGPGFVAAVNCHAAIETKRGHYLGRVIWNGSPEANTGIPEGVAGRNADRVLRAPAGGIFLASVEICEHVTAGQLIGSVEGQPIHAPFTGVLRGLVNTGIAVRRGMKIGDVDPRNDPGYCRLVSDKSLAVGGGVLEAILSRPELRPHLWE